MTGIEKIISGIENECAAAGEAITAEAEAKAKELEAQAAQAARAFLEQGKAAADKKSADALKNAAAADELDSRNRLLIRRREHISAVIDDAATRICALPDDRYFERLLKTLRGCAMNGNAVVRLNARDLKRDLSVLETGLADIGGVTITVSTEPADITGGFILDYGDIEINASLEALAHEKREELVDAVNRRLFAE